MTETVIKTITADDVEKFSLISGDINPIHLDEEYASQSRFKRRIAHGLLTASYFSALFGTKIPGEGCVYASQTLRFRRPVYIGDTVHASVVVIDVNESTKRVTFKTECRVKNKVVTEGEAEIFVP